MPVLYSRPWLVVAAALIITLFFAVQSRHFEINASADTLISEGNALYIQSQKNNQAFSPEEFLILAYQPNDGDVFSAASQKDIAEISQRLTEIPRVASVRSILSVPLLQAGSVDLSGDVDPSALTQQRLQLSRKELKGIFRKHPIYEGLIVNAEQTVSGIQILFKEDTTLTQLNREVLALREKRLDASLSDDEQARLSSLEARQAAQEKTLRETRNREVEQIRTIIGEYRDSASIYLGGGHALAYQLIDIVRQDLKVFGSAIAAVIAVLMLAIFRQWRWLLIAGLCCTASTVISTGAFAMLGLKATVISANFIALLLIMTLAIVIHLIVQYREEVGASPDAGQKELVQLTMAHKRAPCFFAGLTTSIGFASLMLSDIKPVWSFGLMMVMAMIITLAATLLLFPALLLLFDRESPRLPGKLFQWPLKASIHLSLKRGSVVIVAGLVMLVLAVIGAMRLSVENSFINYFNTDTQVYRELAFIDQHFGGSTPLDIIYTPQTQNDEGGDQSLPLRAVSVQQTHRIQDMLDRQQAMGTTLSVVNFTRLARTLNNDRPITEYELAAVYWTLDDAIRKDLLGSFFVDEPPRLRISARVQDSTEGLNRKQLLKDIHSGMDELGIPDSQYQLSNLFVLYQAMLEQLFDSQILTLGAVLVVLTLVFWAVFRSLRLAILAMVPNVIATLAVLGVMGWFGIPLDFMTMTIAAIAMGIAVDDTIHLVHRFLSERRSAGVDQAITRALDSVGYALIYTSTIIALGFVLLVGSDFVPSVMFGLLTALAVMMALIVNLTLLPALLKQFTAKPE